MELPHNIEALFYFTCQKIDNISFFHTFVLTVLLPHYIFDGIPFDYHDHMCVLHTSRKKQSKDEKPPLCLADL